MQHKRRTHPGIRIRHRRACDTTAGGACTCSPTYEAEAYVARDKAKIRRSFRGPGALAAARAWRRDAVAAVGNGKLRAPTQTTLREGWDEWIDGARAGRIRTRSGDPYKPSAIHGYAQAMESRVLPLLGAAKLSAIDRNGIQDFADRLLAEGLDPSTVRNILMPLRVLFRRALFRNELALNPTAGLLLPAVRGRRERVASVAEAAALLNALPEQDRALWATAMYAGLRRGELLALPWQDVDLTNRQINVRRSYDPKAAVFVSPKSAAGVRGIPIITALREHLVAHRLRSGRAHGLVFGGATEPVDYWAAMRRARRAWKDAGLKPIGLHECRHTCASFFIASGMNMKTISTFMGHSSITITIDRYGHLVPGDEKADVARVDSYLSRSTG